MAVVLNVKLKNFGGHGDFELGCNRPTTLIIGENGSGKTSVLESVYLALRGKSFKGVDREIMKREQDFFRAGLCDPGVKSGVIVFCSKDRLRHGAVTLPGSD